MCSAVAKKRSENSKRQNHRIIVRRSEELSFMINMLQWCLNDNNNVNSNDFLQIKFLYDKFYIKYHKI